VTLFASCTLPLVQERGGPRPFDVATRRLIEFDPEGWLRWIGLPVDGPVVSVDTEVSTVLAEVDKVLRVEAASPWLAHLELQASRDPTLPLRLRRYHAILLYLHRIPVVTTVVLLLPQAGGQWDSGHFIEREPNGDVTVSFNYRVIRLWERPVEELLGAGLGVVPLAPLTTIDPGQLPSVLDRLDERFEREAPTPSAVDELWAATLLLMGVRYDRDAILGLSQRVRRMRESVTYQIILEEGEALGRLRQARRDLLDLGTEKFGAPDALTMSTLSSLDDAERLGRMVRAILRANSWQELLSAGQG
jgi:predicted transposase YdaD